MSRKKTTENRIKALCKKYPNMRFVDSNENGLYYAVCPNDDRLAVICGGGTAIFTLEQLYAMTKEAIEVWTNCIDDDAKRSNRYVPASQR